MTSYGMRFHNDVHTRMVVIRFVPVQLFLKEINVFDRTRLDKPLNKPR